MPATREQLEDRWETSEGQQLAREVCHLLARGVSGPSRPREVTRAELQWLTASLPFREEVAPSLDLRGLHLSQERVNLYQALDLSGAHLDYVYEIGGIVATRMIGTIFDGCYSTNADFFADFTSASFVGAKLQGVHFLRSTLVQTNFRQAKLALAEFRELDCRRASFVEADLRFSELNRADLRGADFSGANLTEANLAKANLIGIQFNEKTQLRGTDLYDALLDEPFRAFAEQAGGLLRDDQDPSFKELEWEKLLAAIKVLKQDNEQGRLDAAISCLEELSRQDEHDLKHVWIEAEKILSPELMQEVLERYAEVGRALAYYL